MKKFLPRLVAGLLAGLLAACVKMAAPTGIAVVPPLPSVTPLPPTATAVPVPVSGLTDLSMIDAATGWAWATRPDSSFQLLRTADGGQTWRDVTPQSLPIVSSGSFFLDGQDAWVQLFNSTTNAGGLVFTGDGGRTWAAIDKALPFATAALHFTDPKNGWAESADVGAGNAYVGIYVTSDGGTSWSQLPLRGPDAAVPSPTPGTVHLCNICGDVLYFDPQRLIVTSGDLASGPGGAVRLSISTDLGGTWKDLKLPLPDAKHNDYLIAPQSPVFFTRNDGLLPVQMTLNSSTSSATDLAVYATHDGGLSWTALPAVLKNASPNDLAMFVTPLDGFARCGNNLCSTNDGARTWQTLPPSLNFDSFAASDYVFHYEFVSPTTGWAISTDGSASSLWTTTTNGAGWTKVSPVLVP
jgi:photosystem II stability/assembly factor-like uncharacterized protein